ncbi:LacI family DNA-binding transcriptional regulator [Bifidobacterium parmae]|uniref:Sugar-binding protein n=1 Tax=Bifidobacterium parmae TaxID=361854 RepID=A0A2N5J0V7_9BIFI|nr:LacI family DNA-binding transcriptional regulator [Bifidobacterium parmae]PLS27832.1 sugar-binding protein [Bifidobacterium parmae]
MPARRKVGVSDVAKRAGVSIGTVSNYLNYPERVSDTLKAKIGAAIAELGYVPRRSAPAPGPSAKGTPVIGYVMTDIEHSLFTSVFEGVQEVCEENGMQVIALNASSDLERQHALVDLLIGMKVTGILLSTVQDSAQDVAAARAAGIPVIVVDHSHPHGCEPACAILENNLSVGRIAAEELIRTGCRRIAFAAHSFDYEQVQDRQLGVQKAVMAAGGDVTFTLIDSGGLMVEDGYQLGLALSGKPQDAPDGIVAVADAVAVGIIVGLEERGVLRVPDDIAVIGSEGAHLPAVSPMPLTVVQAPGVDMGRKAMLQMLDYLEDPITHVHGTMLLEPTLVRRESTRRTPDGATTD